MYIPLKRFRYWIIGSAYLLLVLLFFADFRADETFIRESFRTKRDLVEQNVRSSLEDTETAHQLIGHYVGSDMEEKSTLLAEKYEDSRDVLSWDLDHYRELFGGEYEIYIIDEELEIVHTTFEPDLGLDFNQWPAFARLVRERLEGDSFVADRSELSVSTGRLTKYSFLPTFDNRYIIQLSKEFDTEVAETGGINLLNLAERLREDYGSIEAINFYKPTGGRIDDDAPTNVSHDLDPQTEEHVTAAFENNTVVTREGSDLLSYRYLPMVVYDEEPAEEENINLWSSFVAEIVYDGSPEQAAIRTNRSNLVQQIVFVTVVFLGFSAVMDRLLRNEEYHAEHDSMTELPNRAAITRLIGERVESAHRAEERFAVLFLDIDDFKTVNDEYGHHVGDTLLTILARRLRTSLREEDRVGRLSGDEFIIVLHRIESERDIDAIVRKLVDTIGGTVKIEDLALRMTVSIGATIFPDDAESSDELLQRADKAMYRIKGDRGSYAFYSDTRRDG